MPDPDHVVCVQQQDLGDNRIINKEPGSVLLCSMCSPLLLVRLNSLIIFSLQACPEASAHSWKQWPLQHDSVSYLALCPHFTAEGLEQLCTGRGLLLC